MSIHNGLYYGIWEINVSFLYLKDDIGEIMRKLELEFIKNKLEIN